MFGASDDVVPAVAHRRFASESTKNETGSWTTPQLVFLLGFQAFACILSILGSFCILHISRRRWKSKLYHRFLFGLSIGDIIFTTAILLSPYLMPADDPVLYRPFTFGNTASCSAVGFFTWMGSNIVSFYSCYLALYYLLLLRYNQKVEDFVMKYEILSHVVAFGIPIALNTAAAFTRNFNPSVLIPVCSLNEYPEGCRDDGIGGSCERGLQIYNLGYAVVSLSIVPTWVSIGSTFSVYWKVRRVLGRNLERIFRTDLSRRDQSRRIRQIAIQSFLYFAAYFNSLLWPFLYWLLYETYEIKEMLVRIGDPVFFGFQFMTGFMYPLQGFINMLVYVTPIYNKWRVRHPHKSMFWIFRKVLWSDENPSKLSNRQMSCSPQDDVVLEAEVEWVRWESGFNLSAIEQHLTEEKYDEVQSLEECDVVESRKSVAVPSSH